MQAQNTDEPLLIAIDSAKTVQARAKEYARQEQAPWHLHDRAQLIYAVRGVMEISTEQGWWLVPAQRALWMPARLEHSMKARSAVSLRTLYVAPDCRPASLPDEVTSVAVTPLLTALIIRASEYALAARSEKEVRLLAVIMDELVCLPDSTLHLPRARDPRLRTLCAALQDNPADPRSLQDWAGLCGASSRTLARLFQHEFGMSYLAWRNHAAVLNALAMLAEGKPVTAVALELGYESAAAFSTMFKRFMGDSPSRYMTARH